ncbi:rod shape-determining protein RodA [Blastomonas sp. AAP53]|uniref:rod shape-determining protein RodA n=1 Tax=Blastomonas sp. AAP53 TaxID=1248760 RepID=UPI0002E54BFE|nr:rod shape-determining protein RodA [Blastomonas sp. AAP53]
MLSIVPRPIADLPWRAITLLLLIAGLGVIVLYSAAGGNASPWALSHAIRFSVLFTVALVMSRLPLSWYRHLAFPAYGVAIIMVLLTELVGHVAGGAQSWLDLGIIRLQPSELAKPALVLALARFYELVPPSEVRKLGGIWPPVIMILVPTGLVILQPDLGTAITILASGAVAMFLAGTPIRLFAIGGLAGVVSVPLLLIYGFDHWRNRAMTFLDPASDPLGAGYHITQSKIAIGSGGIFGKGFLNGTQVHLNYLPEGHTDFVFALIAEEFGLAGGLFLIVGFILLTWWGLGVALAATERFQRIAAATLATTVFIYVAINLLMVMGLAPVIGIPLPLISHGGSSMMTVMICMGMLMAIDRNNRQSGSSAGRVVS